MKYKSLQEIIEGLDLIRSIQQEESKVVASLLDMFEEQCTSAWGYVNKGLALSEKGFLDGAISNYRQAIEISPTFALAHYYLGNAFNRQGKFDEAVVAFEKSLEFEKSPWAYRGLGRALLNAGKLDEALSACKKAVELNPDSALSHFYVGCVLFEQNKYESASSAIQKAIILDSKNYFFYYFLGIISIAQDVVDDMPFRKAIELNPGFANAHLVLGHVLIHKEKQDEAIKHYKIAAQLGNKDAEKMLAELDVGK